MTEDTPTLADLMAEEIAANGPIPVADYMARANAHYYAHHDPFGAKGDFITAPEISQMFGELIGAWMADLWIRAGRPQVHYVELGPGRGTLAADALRAMHSAGLAPPVHFVETSPVLRAAQKERIPHAVWHDSLDTLPDDRPLLVAANEFFDALPIRQLVKTFSGWRERMVGLGPEGFEPVPGTVSFDDKVPDHLRTAALGSIIEAAPTAMKLARALARRLAAQGGAAIIIDYGHENYAAGDTLQALSDHAYADVFANPGGHDITAHVDFTELVRAGRGGGARVRGPVAQCQFLGLLGIAARAAALAHATPIRAQDIAAAHHRLTSAEEMGELFKAVAYYAKDWPEPAGF
jgi:SAM-dependent MidA family methyltransferase